MNNNYEDRAALIIGRLFAAHLTPDRLMKIGAFVVQYGLFETTLEQAVWTLTETDVRGVRPFTEKLNAESMFNAFGAGNAKLSEKCNAVLRAASLAAVDLSNYRNSLMHGYLIPSETNPCFLRNPGWNGEVRNKKPGDAYVGEPLLDLAIISASTLHEIAIYASAIFSDSKNEKRIEALESNVREARSCASELRHLRSLMNEEKY
ncbi:TPA: hypothetical protein RQP16_002320 [Klebsiella michiganensis]|uniref:hypothetical protein n=1 Tax=Klebsiella michiganensis TaxID=1134687 RepID=UPI0009076931|nr:hypothetical protein [Klebsiella michiganensis]EKQ6536098.1 hypothetical protein [Klebsiella michiganensis]ELQ7988141.1 hypothetical protein [Klebsiella michiganensis]MBZ7914111.1 hypothetical protein [Klebsiella michiganensis]MCW9597315.1 hypothetical protein [Klebsiella michiganensis]HDX9238816.1 hypothetical protein [Klebsiella michiganensis]